MSSRSWPWLVARPIAHRGLHGSAPLPVENTIPAIVAAADAHYAVECDVRLSSDGVAVVFHDATLDRLTRESGPLAARSAAALARTPFRRGAAGIPTLAAVLDAAGRMPVVVELKSAFDGDMRLADAVAAELAGRDAEIALKSFDLDIMLHLRGMALACPLGLVIDAVGAAAANLHAKRAALQPDFLSFAVDDLPHALPAAYRARGVPVMAWTVRTAAQRACAAAHADAMIFEGLDPLP